MNQSFCSELRPLYCYGRLLSILLAVFYLAFTRFVHAEDGSCCPMGKQDRNLETWSIHTRLDFPDKEKPIYLGIFFVSGKLYFFKGNFAHIFWMDASSKEYFYESDIFIPPFEQTKHDEEKLNQEFHKNSMRHNKEKNMIQVIADFKKLHTRLNLYPEKKSVWFHQVFDKNKEDMNAEWYMLPRAQITADINADYNITATGIGHFQHYWGDEAIESGDLIVAHMDSGDDIIISDYLVKDAHSPHIPNDYIVMTNIEDEKRIIRKFKYLAVDHWQSKSTKKKYPTRVSVKSEDEYLSLEICAFKKDQTATLLGVEKWFGYGSVEGTINNIPQKGWAFMNMHGEEVE